MTKTIDALTARTHFGELMRRAEKEQARFLVSSRGKAKVVIMGVEDYLRTVVKAPEVVARMQQNAAKSGLDKLSDVEIETLIRDARSEERTKK